MIRYVLMLALLLLAVAIPSRFVPSVLPQEPVGAVPVDVPETVTDAAEQGRYWRASRLMGDYLATVRDTTPSALLLAAELHAGWEDWASVAELLEGRDWLDRERDGAGWELLGRSRMARDEPAAAADAFRRFLDLNDPADAERALTEIRMGLALARAAAVGSPAGTGDHDPAGVLGAPADGRAFDRAADLLPWFEDWVALFAAEAAAAIGDTAAVRDRLAVAGAVANGRGWRLRMDAALVAGDSLAAREVALEAARAADGSGTRASAWAELGALRLAAGDTARAREAFAEAMSAPGSVAAVNGARALGGLVPSPTEWRRIADIYARHGNAVRAVEGYEHYLADGSPGAAERVEVRLRLGEALFNAGRYARAERHLLALAAEDGVPAGVGAEALYLAGRAQYRQGRSAEGQRTLARLPERFPGQETVTRGLYLLGDLRHDDQALDEARRHYRRAAETAPHLSEAGLALMRLGGLALLEEDYESAVAIFEDYRRMHPEGRRWGQATYWSARAHASLGRADTARALLLELRERDPISYHGVRAAEQLGAPLLDIPMTAAPVADSAAEAAVRAGLRRVDALANLGRRDDLVREVERLRALVDGREAAEYALAEALNERGYTLTAIGMGWDLFRRGGEWNPRLLRIIYPFPFRNLVLPEARERGLDPYLVAGLIRRESAFNPTVRSGAGAIGLMQVMPETGRTLARAVDLDGFRPELLTQPEVNLHLGTRYLATMLDRFDHELPLVLSAYNAGPTRAVRWRELPEARDPELFTERIPYAETRDYVRNVVLHRALYRALYPDLEP